MKQDTHKKIRIKKLFPNLFLHNKPETLPIKINWRRVFILPTKPGLFFAFISLLMLTASLNFNNNMGLMLTFLLAGIAQVALYRVFFNLNGLLIKKITTQPVFVGEKAKFSLHLYSHYNKYDICVGVEKAIKCLLHLPAQEIRILDFTKKTQTRGWLKGGKIKLRSSYPFGLFYAWIWTKVDEACLIYPAPEKNPPPMPLLGQNHGKNTVINQGENFHGLKPYQSGDSIRLIAWKRTAQTGELITREFEQTRGDRLLFDYAQIPLPNQEAKISRLTAWVINAHKSNREYSLKLPSFNSGYNCSAQHYLTCLKSLALYGDKVDKN